MSTRFTRPTRAAWAQGVLLSALAVLVAALLAWHMPLTGWQAPAPAQAWTAAGVVAAWLLTCLWPMYRRHRQARAAGRVAARMHQAAAGGADEAGTPTMPWLVACASQTGVAEELSDHTAATLAQAGIPVERVELGALDAGSLARAGHVLFVVSTTGDGDAPDPAAAFAARVMTAPADLDRLRYGLLALGDSDYDDFCGFGHTLDRWLRAQGATTLFDLIEVDDEDPDALRRWQHHLGVLSGAGDMPDWEPPRYRPWRLLERRELNPGSVGGPCFHLALQPEAAAELAWQAGDIAEIGPCHARETVAAFLQDTGLDGTRRVDAGRGMEPLADVLARSRLPDRSASRGVDAAILAASLEPLPHREYSIASLPADGALHLLVRYMQHADGRPGLGSGWLTRHAPEGAPVDLRIRTNANFHPPRDDRPLVLVGNGTGLAGLRALLKARLAAGHHDNWLLFGERQAARDFFYRDEIETWHREGRLSRLDLAFSRDQEARMYVQHLLAAHADTLRRRIADGASLYVCGSLAMGHAVDEVLARILGAGTLERLAVDGRYRRDVY